MILEILNISFFILHTLLIGFNLVGWAFRRTRPWHLATLGLVALSWFGLGLWYGWGYCLCTDWHWRVRQQLGYLDENGSYIYLLIHALTGLEPSVPFCEALALTVFTVAAALTLTLTWRDWRCRKRDLCLQGKP
jgi:hypothetical protein